MSLNRRFTIPAHGVIEFIAGISMMLAPVIFGFSAGGLVISATLGAILTGMGLTLSADPLGQALRWHGMFDSFFVLITALAALALALAGDAPAAVFLAVLVAVQACLSWTTSYVATT